MQIEHNNFLFRDFTGLYIYTIFTVSINAGEKVEIDVEQVYVPRENVPRNSFLERRLQNPLIIPPSPHSKEKKRKKRKKKKPSSPTS